MSIARWLVCIALLIGCAGGGQVFASEFSEDFERSVLLKNKGELHITNNRGDLVIEGYSQDRIRVRGRRIARVEGEAEARRLFAALDVRTRTLEEVTEISAEYGRGLTLQERLKERQNPRTRMNFQIQAPSSRTLRIWSVDGKVVVRGWKGPVEVRASSGSVTLDNVKGEFISILCPACEVKATAVRGQFRCMGGSGAISVSDVDGAGLYVETVSGAVKASGVKSDQLYVSRSGFLQIDSPRGRVEFHTEDGAVELTRGDGFASGRTTSGNMTIRMHRWKFQDKALFESVGGRIELELPREFQGEMDVRSLRGKVAVEFPLLRSDRGGADVAPDPHHRFGRVGDGGELLRLMSEQGDISVKSEKPSSY